MRLWTGLASGPLFVPFVPAHCSNNNNLIKTRIYRKWDSNTSSLGFSRVVNECEIEAIRVISMWHVKGRFGAKEFSESIPKRPALKVILQWASPIVSGSWRCKN